MSISAEEAKKLLIEGNEKYLDSKTNPGDISPAIRLKTWKEGQYPYAIIMCCADSREIPEAIFCAGIGDLFVIRVAGNVLDSHQLGSMEYAADHLGCKLILVLGHTFCGAVDAAIHHEPDGHIKYITDNILEAIGEEKDPYKASCMNVDYVVKKIEEDPHIKAMKEDGLTVMGAMYHIEDGRVEFL